MKTGVAAALAVLAVMAAVGIGLASSAIFRPASPTPIRVSVSSTPAPTPSATPYDEAALFRGPISGGCATATGVWVITDGGGLLRYDGTQWAQVDSTLRSLTRAACTQTAAYAVGHVGALLISDEATRSIKTTDVTIQDLWGISPVTDGAWVVGSHGMIIGVDDGGDAYPFPTSENIDLFDVVAFTLNSAWAVGDRGITYRLDARGWTPIGTGQTNALRSVAGTTPANVIAVGDAGTVMTFVGGAWLPAKSGVDVTLRDVIVDPAVWIAGDAGTLLTSSGAASAPFRKIDLGTDCNLVSLFARSGEIWVVGKSMIGGGVWRLRAADGTVIKHYGGC
jgi:hypothetical protein